MSGRCPCGEPGFVQQSDQGSDRRGFRHNRHAGAKLDDLLREFDDIPACNQGVNAEFGTALSDDVQGVSADTAGGSQYCDELHL